jgi:hypothetical protein
LGVTKVGRVGELEHLGGHRGVPLHDCRDVGGVRVGPRGHLRQLEVRARHRWESLEAPDDRSNRVAREDRLKITRSGKRGTQDRLVARFGQKLLRHGHRPQDGLSVGLARKNQPRSARVVLAHAGQELRTIHFRHPHVRHDDVEGCAPELLQCLLASGHEDHVPSCGPPALHRAPRLRCHGRDSSQYASLPRFLRSTTSDQRLLWGSGSCSERE